MRDEDQAVPNARNEMMQIGQLRLDRSRRLAERKGEPLDVEPRVLALLWHLGERAGAVCSKQELLDAVWPDRVVSESTLYRAIALARDLIAPEAAHRIRTVHGRGYELVGPIPSLDDDAPTVADPVQARASDRKAARRWLALAVLLVPLAVLWITMEHGSEVGGPPVVDLQIGRFGPNATADSFPGTALWMDIRSDLARLDALRLHSEPLRGRGAWALLQGEWRRYGSELAVYLELIEQPSGRLIWSANLITPVADADRIRHQAASQIARALDLRTVNPAGESLPLPIGATAGTYERFLRARSLWRQRDGQALAEARALLESVIAEAPEFARAHEALASLYVVLPDWADVDIDTSRELAWAAAREALRKESRLGEARAVLAQQAMHQGQWSEAERMFRQALEREPANATILQWYAEFLLRVGRIEDAARQAQIAVEIDATTALPRAVLAWTSLLGNRPERAVEAAEEARRMGLDVLGIVAAWAQWQLGRPERASALIATLPQPTPALLDCASAVRGLSPGNEATARLIAAHRQDELAEIYTLACLAMLDYDFERSQDFEFPRPDSGAFSLVWSRELASYRSSLRFGALATETGLMAYWRSQGPPDACRLEGRTLDCGFDAEG